MGLNLKLNFLILIKLNLSEKITYKKQEIRNKDTNKFKITIINPFEICDLIIRIF